VAVGVLCYVLGIIWVFLFPLVCITTGESKCRGTYMSENALLPGAGRVAFNRQQLSQSLDLAQQLRQAPTTLAQQELIADRLRLVDHTVDVDISARRGIVQAVARPWPADDRKEALVLCAMLNARTSSTLTAALAAEVFVVLSQAKWLSKNVILLVVNDQESLQGWLHRYHSANLVDDEDGDGDDVSRAGVIRGALVLDVSTASRLLGNDVREELDILIHGVNGRLPNMDLINTIVRTTPRYMRAAFDQQSNRGTDGFHSLASVAHQTLDDVALRFKLDQQVKEQGHDYVVKMESLFRFMRGTAMGPTGLHAFFLDKGVDSLTLSLELSNDSTVQMSHSEEDVRYLLGLAQVTESTVRSLSNLSEKLHQSYYLYLMPSTYQFVSIGEYSGPLLLVLAPLLTALASLLFRGASPSPCSKSSPAPATSTTTSTSKSTSTSSSSSTSASLSSAPRTESTMAPQSSNSNLSLSCLLFSMSLAAGIALLRVCKTANAGTSLRPLAIYLSSVAGITSADSKFVWHTSAVSSDGDGLLVDALGWIISYAGVFVAFFVVVLPLAKLQLSTTPSITTPGHMAAPGGAKSHCDSYWQPLKCCLMVFLVIAHGAIGMVSFPFAMLSGLMCAPVYATARPGSWLTLVLLALTAMPVQVLILRAGVADPQMWGVSGQSASVDSSGSSTDELVNYLVSWLMNDAGVDVVEAVQALMFGLRSFNSLHLAYICVVQAPAQLMGWAIWLDRS
jgi:hypothetical protein